MCDPPLLLCADTDALISAPLCLLVIVVVVLVALLIPSGYICLRTGPLPLVLVRNTSISLVLKVVGGGEQFLEGTRTAPSKFIVKLICGLKVFISLLSLYGK